MNIVVLSPKNRGVGVSSIAYMLGVSLKHKGEFVQLMDVNSERSGLMSMFKSVKKLEGNKFDGMSNIMQLVRTGTISPEDMENNSIDIGVNTICVNSSITTKDAIDIIELTKNSTISGRTLYTIIDLNEEDSNTELFKEVVKQADICVFVLTQDYEAIMNVANSYQLNDQAMRKHGISTCYVVNRFEDCSLQLKSIWSMIQTKDTKHWYKVRYNPHIMQVKSLGLYTQFAAAMHEVADHDIARVKTDIAKIAGFITTKQH